MRQAPRLLVAEGSLRRISLRACLDLERSNVHAALQATREFDGTGNNREQRIVAATTDIIAGVEVRTALAHDDGAGIDLLARVTLHAEALSLRIAAVLS